MYQGFYMLVTWPTHFPSIMTFLDEERRYRALLVPSSGNGIHYLIQELEVDKGNNAYWKPFDDTKSPVMGLFDKRMCELMDQMPRNAFPTHAQ